MFKILWLNRKGFHFMKAVYELFNNHLYLQYTKDKYSTFIAGSSAAAPPANTCSTLISGWTLLSKPPDTHSPVV